VERNPETNI